MRWGLMASLGLALGGGPLAHGAAAPTPIPSVTRLVRLFGGLENDWLAAVRRHDTAALDAVLSEDFEMRAASRPDQPIPRGEWIKQALSGRSADWTLHQMAARDLGCAVIVSFRLEAAAAAPGAAPRRAFVVDTWVQSRGAWKAAARYVGSAQSLPAGLAGDAAPPAALPRRY